MARRWRGCCSSWLGLGPRLSPLAACESFLEHMMQQSSLISSSQRPAVRTHAAVSAAQMRASSRKWLRLASDIHLLGWQDGASSS